jgi:hypothetical protein
MFAKRVVRLLAALGVLTAVVVVAGVIASTPGISWT